MDLNKMEQDFNDFAVLGKRSFSLGRVIQSAIYEKNEGNSESNIIKNKESASNIDLDGLSFT